MALRRRKFLTGAAVGGTALASASAFPRPAISQNLREWRMITSWPKGLPGVGAGAEKLAADITRATEGRISVTVYAGGELAPALEVFDNVANGTAQLGHDASYYHLGKSMATAFFTAVPYGFTASELNAWVYKGGGQELWDELYAGFGLKAFLAGNTGTQMLGWFRNEINSPDDFQGLRYRMPGLGGRAIERLGATVTLLPGAEIYPALQAGTIDATEWIGPWNDYTLGFYQVAPYYYYPGYHEPGSGLELTINLDEWNGLEDDLKAILAGLAAQSNNEMYADYNANSGPALRQLVSEEGVQLRQAPQDVLVAIGNAVGEVMQEIYDSDDEMTRRIGGAYHQFRRDIIPWSRVGEQAFQSARLLPYEYGAPS